MKIRKITYKGSPIFGDLELDFIDSNGKAANTIIIAGENGVGKSRLLNDIYEFPNPSYMHGKRNEVRIFEIELSNLEMKILKESEHSKNFFENIDLDDNIFIFTVDFSISHDPSHYNIQVKTKTSILNELRNDIFNGYETNNILKILFSDTEINFTPSSITSITSRNIDVNELISEKSNQNLATDITQLLIDIESLDALELANWARNNLGQPIEKNMLDTRLKRFTDAYDFMFPTKRFIGINHNMGLKEVMFEENGKKMSINQLSSGEKQIVFRGGFLLKNKESSRGSLVLIDEPEISLHPNWQIKVLNFFQKLFTNDIGIQTSQIIISTHSPFILHNVNRKDDKVIILQKDPQGNVIVPEEAKFFGWSAEKIVQKAFNISNFLSPNKTTVFLEGITDEKYFNKCLEIYNKTNLPIEFKWIGRVNESGNHENTGDKALNSAMNFILANLDYFISKIILFYDVDTNKPEITRGNLLIRTMKGNNKNNIFKKGVENLLTIDKNFEVGSFYNEKHEIDDYSAKSIRSSLDKTKLCDYICDNLGADEQKIILANLNNEIDRLLSS